MKNKGVLVMLLFFCFVATTNAVKTKKLKRVNEEILKREFCKIDSVANAAFLHDEAFSYFRYDDNKGFRMVFNRKFRLKIYNKNGLDWADFSIRLYHDGQSQEDIFKLKGTVYNLVNGKIEKSKVRNDNKFMEKESEKWDVCKVAFPDVKEGSVIDLEYTIESDFFFNLQPWNFQYTIPVLYSNFYVVIPEYFNYKELTKGYFPISRKIENGSETFHIKYSERGRGNRETKYEYDIEPRTLKYSYTGENIPAIKNMNYLPCVNDYRSRVEFELKSTDFTSVGGSFKSFSEDWSSVDDKLFNSFNFYRRLNATNFLKETAEKIKKNSNTNEEIIFNAINTVRNQIKWNNRSTIYAERPLRKTWNEKSGNSAEVNLILTALLRECGITANPVVLSTRSNGQIFPFQVSLSKFNYVVVCAEIDNKKTLIDATEGNTPPGILPLKCLNGKGRVIIDKKGEWIDLSPSTYYSSKANYFMKINEKGEISTTLKENKYGYSAIDFRDNLKNYKSKDEYIEKYKEKKPEWIFKDFKIANIDSLHKPIVESMAINIEDKFDPDVDIIYLSPFLEIDAENPFAEEERKYPVDFAAPINTQTISTIQIPEGYKVSEIPENKVIQTTDGQCIFVYQCQQVGRNIQLVTQYIIKKTLFLPKEYKELKNFHDQLISKKQETIVLKKI